MSLRRLKIVKQRPVDTFYGKWGNLFWVTCQDPYLNNFEYEDSVPWTQSEIDFENMLTDLQLSGKLDYNQAAELDRLAGKKVWQREYYLLWLRNERPSL